MEALQVLLLDRFARDEAVYSAGSPLANSLRIIGVVLL